MTEGLIKLDKATQMLAEIRTVDDAKGLISLAEAARVYARQVDLGLEAQNHAAEIKLRAQRRAGEVLKEMEKHEGGRPTENPLQAERSFEDPQTYAEMDIQYRDAHNWQTIASMPEEDFETHIAETKEEGKELTTAGTVRVAKKLIENPPHVSFNTGDNEWYTPLEIMEAVREILGVIDLDPASTAEANTVVQATSFYTKEDDGLTKDWNGRVWMNPPYASELIGQFVNKLSGYVKKGQVIEAIVLVNNATETIWFSELIYIASAVCFPRGRVKFWAPDKVSAPLQGQAIIYIGNNMGNFLVRFQEFGWTAHIFKDN